MMRGDPSAGKYTLSSTREKIGTICCNMRFCFQLINLQVSGAATSPVLADRQKYPTFFRTVASAAKLNLGYLQILKELNWKRVAILTESTEPHTSVSDKLVWELNCNIVIIFLIYF